ncbi:unnamed protein product [Aphanomyces euteiches]|uniref:Uncharacterized protein n=1 Tax=Aphanomyces euteiches TaxID=100861 RepID=A0A6G0WK82_9STRA|nr:hypothetical protein Ae201684_014289 [Aphanomyces euteiches]KAH9068652.1 hypothetical protein Ae201684P_004354 [Aphanomyces euteiches]KAH9137901.1 hypothetical protein AeRB84_017609 [Aphanomyces euteiches]
MRDIVQKQKVRKGGKGRKKRGAEIFQERRNETVQQTRDKKKQARKRLRMVQIQRNIDKQLEHLRAFPVKQVEVVKRPKGPLRPDEWKLRGAARPAALLARIANGECDADGNEFKAPEPTKDFYEEMRGRFAAHKDTLEYLRLRKELAFASCEAGMMDAGIEHFEECMELDPTDAIGAREGLVCALIDEGRADEARAIIDRYDNVPPVLEYCRTIIEYVSWEVLEEEGSSAEIVQAAFEKAWAGNPFIAMFIAGYDAFNSVVEYVEDIKSPAKGSIEEAFVYCAQNIGVWLDTVGARAWIQKEVAAKEIPVATEDNISVDPMYLGMYNTAVEMYQEELAAQDDDRNDHEDDENDDDMDA